MKNLQVSTHESLATLTVVSGPGHANSPHSPRSPHRGATITPIPPDKDVMLLHIEPRPAQHGGHSAQHGGHSAQHGGHSAQHGGHPAQHSAEPLLDLSVKRPRHDVPKPVSIYLVYFNNKKYYYF